MKIGAVFNGHNRLLRSAKFAQDVGAPGPGIDVRDALRGPIASVTLAAGDVGPVHVI
jgi:hypothetical protein